MTTKYYALLTNLGAARLANAAALGTKLQITQMAVGDGGGTLPTPNANQTKLVGEKRRAALNSLSIDAANSSQIIAEQVIPETEGGFWIREIGLFDADGVLIAVANCAETYKPQLQEGSGRTQTVRMILIVSSTDAVTLKIDPSIVLATRQYVDSAVIEVKAYADDLMAKHVAAADPHTQYAPKASPTLTGTPKAPTPAASKNDTQIATTAFVQALIKAHLDAADPHTQYLETNNWLSEFAGLNDTTRKTLLGNIGAAGKAFSMDTGITRLDDTSVTSKTQFVSISGTMEDGPLGAVGYTATLLNIRRVWDAGTSLTQIMFQSGAMYIRTASGGEGKFSFGATAINPYGWRRVYDESSPPTAKEVGALGLLSVLTTDLNNVTEAGVYPVAGDAPNNPYPGAIGVLTQLNYNNVRFVQEFATAQAPAASTNRRWVRYGSVSNGISSWTAWTSITMRPDEVSTGTDLNTLTESGNYYGGAWINGPTAIGNAYGTLKVIATGTGGALTQTLHAVSANRKFIRSYNAAASGWNDWVELVRADSIENNLVPVGIPVPWPIATPPTGWLKCNGASFSATTYPELAKAYPSLKLPDLRGEFIRGWDDGRGADSGRELLSAQSHALQQHTHTVVVPLRTTDSDRGSNDSLYSVDNTQTLTSSGASGNTASETRPRNVAFNYIVRAA